MGRKIRRVPPKWEHPRYTKEDARYPNWVGKYRACYDKDYETASKEWIENFDLWRKGEHIDQTAGRGGYFWEWDSPPDKTTYRPTFTEEPTWYQVYETVSEGTPTTPPFASKAELVEYLVDHGEFHDGERWPRQAAEQFVEREWAPSMMIDGGKIYTVKSGFPE